MTIEEKDEYVVKTNTPGTELDTSIAFLQVPTKIKDKVKAFIDEIADEEDARKMSSGDMMSPLQSTGCFFVISLEQIEHVHALLKKALDPKLDSIDEIRLEVGKALTALQG